MQGFKKLKSTFRKKRGKQPEDPVTATPSRESILPNQQTPSTSGVPILPDQPVLISPGPTVPPNDPVVPPSGVTAHPNELVPSPPEVAALTDEPTALSSQLTTLAPTVLSSQLTAPAPETVIPSNETAEPPSQTTAPAPKAIVPSPKERCEQLPNSIRAIANHNFYRNFWEDAVDKLPKEYKVPEEWLTGIKGENVVDMVKAKVKECEDKQWKIKINGREVVMHEVFGKTLGWVEKLADVGDAAIQYAPGYAALPWAGFRFLLKVKHSRCFLFTSFMARG